MNTNRIFIGQFLPQKMMVNYKLSQAANNFCFKIIELNIFNRCLSVPPLNVKDGFDFYSEDHIIRYYTCRIFPHITFFKYLNLLFENIFSFFFIIKMREDNVWFYNVYKGNMLLFYLLYFFSKKRIYVLLADYNPERASRFTRKLIVTALNKCKGIISLSSRCSDLNSNVLSIPGILFENQLRKDSRIFKRTKRFLLSGTLNENTGLYLAIEVFKNLSEYTLIISGFLSDIVRKEVESSIKDYSNIILLDFIEDYNNYLKLLDSVDFVLSFRDEKKLVNKYNFPSKILEALSLNIPVLSTMYYSELKDIIYFIADYDKDSIITTIRDLYRPENEIQIEKASDNYDKLNTYYTSGAWINAFEMVEKLN